MRLLADCGNSAIKLAKLGPEGLIPLPRCTRDDSAVLAKTLEGGSSLAVVSSGDATWTALQQAWAGRGPLLLAGRELVLPDLGQYATLGHDRLLAGLAAAQTGDAVVVDCGTATTFSAWRATSDGVRFAGGLIAPGAEACLAGLALRAPRLPLAQVAGPEVSACQHDSAGAIAAALAIGYAGFVASCLRRLCAESGIARVVATGAQAERWLPQVPTRSLLVLEGLALVLAESTGD